MRGWLRQILIDTRAEIDSWPEWRREAMRREAADHDRRLADAETLRRHARDSAQ